VTDVVAVTLAQHEAAIERGLTTFVEVGEALLAIRDERLYRQTHATFEDYCRDRWSMSRPRAYQLIEAAAAVSTTVDSGLPAPVNEAQARELARVPEPERADVWQRAVEQTGGKPTAAAVRDVYQPRPAETVHLPEPPAATPEPPAADAAIESFIDSGADVRRARLRHDFSLWMVRATVFDVAPREVAGLVRDEDEWDRLDRRRHDLNAYFDAILSHRPRALRLIGERP
jgi:hypothetical protein